MPVICVEHVTKTYQISRKDPGLAKENVCDDWRSC
jgi:hypothetical protein